jgi:hypothetical protein
MPGFVYVLSNPAMPGLVKVGRTDRLPTQRAIELQTTGVPSPFVIEFAMWFPDPSRVEIIAHHELDDYRVSESREFFRVETFVVTKLLTELYFRHTLCSRVEVRFPDEEWITAANRLSDIRSGWEENARFSTEDGL